MLPPDLSDLLDADFLAAIADPVRLRLLTTLERSPITVEALAAATGKSPSELAPQLDLLAERGLVIADGDLWRTTSDGWVRLAEMLTAVRTDH